MQEISRKQQQLNKEASQEMYANMASSAAVSPVPESDLFAPADFGSVTADLSMAEGASFDVTV